MVNQDVIIIGGGLVGGTLGIALALQGLSVTVIDREAPEDLLKPDVDGRTTAVAQGSKLIFDRLGLWEKIHHTAEPILDIRVLERDSPWSLNYDHKEIGADPMGYIVENKALRQGIFRRASELTDHLTWIAPAVIEASVRHDQEVLVTLTDGRSITASLLVGAEGRLSPSREEAALKTYRWDYHQSALIAHVTHEKPHHGCAWEIFQPQGPFAILPMRACPKTGSPKSGIVWTGSLADIERLLSLDDAAIAHELEELFPYFGPLSFSGKRWSYPLSAMIAKETMGHRLAIVGDAAHVIHPVAGQGVNLGWRGAWDLSQILGEAKRLGMDIGAKSTLRDYQRKRRIDTVSILALTHGMVRLFSNRSSLLSFLRNSGLGMVNEIPPLKRRMMRKAMGI